MQRLQNPLERLRLLQPRLDNMTNSDKWREFLDQNDGYVESKPSKGDVRDDRNALIFGNESLYGCITDNPQAESKDSAQT